MHCPIYTIFRGHIVKILCSYQLICYIDWYNIPILSVLLQLGFNLERFGLNIHNHPIPINDSFIHTTGEQNTGDLHWRGSSYTTRDFKTILTFYHSSFLIPRDFKTILVTTVDSVFVAAVCHSFTSIVCVINILNLQLNMLLELFYCIVLAWKCIFYYASTFMLCHFFC